MCILCVHTFLLKVVCRYDFDDPSMSAKGFQKKTLDRQVGVWGESIKIFLGNFVFFLNFAKPLTRFP